MDRNSAIPAKLANVQLQTGKGVSHSYFTTDCNILMDNDMFQTTSSLSMPPSWDFTAPCTTEEIRGTGYLDVCSTEFISLSPVGTQRLMLKAALL